MQAELPPRSAARFRIERLLAEGAFGAVYLATQVELARPVALKVLHAGFADDAEARARLIDEARVAAALSHPNIVRALDHDADEGVAWIAYEYAPGSSLQEKVAGGPVPVPQAVAAVCQIAEARQLGTLGDGLRLSHSEEAARLLARQLTPVLNDLDAVVARVLAAPLAAPERTLDAEMALCGAVATACVYRLRLDRARQLGALAGRVRREGAPGFLDAQLLSRGTMAIRYDAALAGGMERFLRLAGTVIARSVASTDHHAASPVLAWLFWAAGTIRGVRFPDPEQRVIDQLASRLWRQALDGAGDEQGKRLVRVAALLWELGCEDDARMESVRFAAALGELGRLRQDGSPAASCLESVKEMMDARQGRARK